MSSSGFDIQALGRVIEQLKNVCRLRAFERAVGVGRLVIAELYCGDLELWRRKQTRLRSFRLLATHPELPLSASDLYRCVAIYEILTRYDARARWPALTLSHFRSVIGLELAAQARLLASASEKSWSVARLARAARESRAETPERRGRPAAPGCAKVLQQMGRLVSSGTIEDPSVQLAELDAELRHELRQALAMIQSFCSRLEPQIELAGQSGAGPAVAASRPGRAERGCSQAREAAGSEGAWAQSPRDQHAEPHQQ